MNESREHNGALGVVDVRRDPDALQRILQGTNVFGPHVNNGVGIATDRAGIDNLGHGEKNSL